MVLMGHVIQEKMTDIPIDCVRKLYEEMANKVQFTKVLRTEDDDVAKYQVKVRMPWSLNHKWEHIEVYFHLQY